MITCDDCHIEFVTLAEFFNHGCLQRRLPPWRDASGALHTNELPKYEGGTTIEHIIETPLPERVPLKFTTPRVETETRWGHTLNCELFRYHSNGVCDCGWQRVEEDEMAEKKALLAHEAWIADQAMLQAFWNKIQSERVEVEQGNEPNGLNPDYRQPAPDHRLPLDSAERKRIPMGTGLIDYFPDALAEVAKVSQYGNDKHNPGEPLHHARGKSMDHEDCIIRHYVDRYAVDPASQLDEAAFMIWRGLAFYQDLLEKRRGLPLPRGAWPA